MTQGNLHRKKKKKNGKVKKRHRNVTIDVKTILSMKKVKKKKTLTKVYPSSKGLL